jgi:hypothetical protein
MENQEPVQLEVALDGGTPDETRRMSYRPIQTDWFTMQSDFTPIATLKKPRQYVPAENILIEVAANSGQALRATTNPDGRDNQDVINAEDVTAGFDFLVFHVTDR